MTVPAFDAVLEHLEAAFVSMTELEALGQLWSLGEDGWLREDPRFRPTPWGHWIPSDRYLVNDLLVRALREGPSELSLAGECAMLSKVVGRVAVCCAADPRIRLDGDRVRLAPSELGSEPLLEVAEPIFQYVTHLPVVTLRAAAASEPAGEWGPHAFPQQVEPMGWLRVERLGRPLNPRMFVARVTGHSMDGGTRPIEDGDWVVFEFSFHEGVGFDSGSDFPVVLVRGEFCDPETGTYAVKRWDRYAPEIRLVSANPDKSRFPDIVVPLDEAEHLRVVANFTRVLAPSDFARRPKPLRKPGRRVVEGLAGLDEQSKRLGRRIESFFADRSARDGEGGTRIPDGWRTRLVCLSVADGGLHLEVGPLVGLPAFVKKLRAEAADRTEGILLAANARSRIVSLPMGPGGGPWHWQAIGFEEEDDLGLDRLAAEACPSDAVSVFRLDANAVGHLQSGRLLALGQAYRLLVPPGLGGAELGEEAGDGWRLWTIDLATIPSPSLRTGLRDIGLDVGEAWPRMEWALCPPARWKSTSRGEAYPVYDANREIFVHLSGLPGDEDEASLLFLRGPSGVDSLALPPQGEALVSLGTPAVGRWACALVHPRTAVRTTTLLFEVADGPCLHVDAHWSVCAEDLADGSPNLSTLEVSAPPGWPVSFSWRALSSEPIETVHPDDERSADLTKVLSVLEDRGRRSRVGDLVVDLADLGREVVPYNLRPTVAQLRVGLTELWTQRQTLVRNQPGAWLTLIPRWFSPVCAHLGYSLGEALESSSANADDGLAAWLLVIEEREAGMIRRSPARVLVLTEDLDATLTVGFDSVDRACGAAGVREAIVSDGIHWTTHRKGNRLRRPGWDLGEALANELFEHMLAALAEGL